MALTLSSVDNPIYSNMSFYATGGDYGDVTGTITLTNPSNGVHIDLVPTFWSQAGMASATSPVDMSPYIYNGNVTVTVASPNGSASLTVPAINGVNHGSVTSSEVVVESGVNEYGYAKVGTPVVIKLNLIYEDHYTGPANASIIAYYNRGTFVQSAGYAAATNMSVSGSEINFTYGSSCGYYFSVYAEVNGNAYGGSVCVPLVLPNVESISPNTGTVGNAAFTITGQGFKDDNYSGTLGNISVALEGQAHTYLGAITVTSQTNTAIEANVNNLNITATRYYYLRANGVDTALTYTLEVPVAPAITNPTPHSARYGDTVTVTGTNFKPTTYFAGQVGTGPMTPIGNGTYVSPTQMQMTIPQPEDQTVVTVNLYAFNGSLRSAAWSFTIYKSAPVIMDPTPHTCVKGIAIFIGGRFFDTPGSVKLNGVAINLPTSGDLIKIKNTLASMPENAGGTPPADASALTSAWNSNIIVALIPPGSSGGSLTVTNSNGISNSWNISVVDLGVPDCTEAVPANPEKTQFIINGSHFGDVRGSVKANGQDCTILNWSNNQIAVQLPNGV